MTDLFVPDTSIQPYPGAVDDEFHWHLVKYIETDVIVETQVQFELPTPALFTVDFLLRSPRRTVAVEIRQDRTLAEHKRRLRRDATLLSTGRVDAIYGLRGSELIHRMDDVLYVMSQWDATLFSERGQINLTTLASSSARAVRVRPEQPSVLVTYDDPLEDRESSFLPLTDDPTHILVRRLDARFPHIWRPYVDANIPTTTHD